AAEDVAAADDHAQLDAELGTRGKIGSEPLDHRLVDAEALRAGERLAGELDDDASVARITHSLAVLSAGDEITFGRRRPSPRQQNRFPGARSPRRARNAQSRSP